MNNIFLNKNNFLYNKNNSITHELCKEIIENFENDYNYNKHLFINYKNEIVFEIPNNILNYPFYYKLKKFLIKEINKNIDLYKNKMNSCLYFNNSSNYNVPFNVLNTKVINIESTFFIKKKIFIENDNALEYLNKINSAVRVRNDNIIILSFVWFLNDVSCELVFWNEYKFKSSVGTLFIYPVSWCFPYEQIIETNQDQYIITGNIYKN